MSKYTEKQKEEMRAIGVTVHPGLEGPFQYPKAISPEPDRMIKVRGYDWTEFTAVGKFVPNQDGSRVRFMRFFNGLWQVDTKTWQDTETWEYSE